jgi:hypothetical protein
LRGGATGVRIVLCLRADAPVREEVLWVFDLVAVVT